MMVLFALMIDVVSAVCFHKQYTVLASCSGQRRYTDDVYGTCLGIDGYDASIKTWYYRGTDCLVNEQPE